MKRTPSAIALILLLANPGLAQPVAILARNDARVLGSSAVTPTDPVKASFWTHFTRDRERRVTYEAEIPVMNPGPWGRIVGEQTGGTLRYHRRFPHGFVCRLELHGLAPHHPYVFTLNGNSGRAGNHLLSTPAPGNEAEKYYDFFDIETDAEGSYRADLGVFLRSGDYEVRFYVKDPDDFKIVLYADHFTFSVD